LKRRISEDPKGRDVQWDDLLCFNNPTCSPDGRFVAAEVYPAGPEDLRRKESKILVYERCPHIPEWGRPHVYPVEWSEDGRFSVAEHGKAI